jgi:hypothetical protein
MSEECKHGLDPQWCSICLHGLPKRDAITVEFVMTAKHPGQCHACNLPVAEGQRIAKLSNETYVHVGCRP